MTERDAVLGAKVWEVLHAIAVNFPSKGQGLSQKRLQGYFNFFESLKYVLPRDSWRTLWKDVTAQSLTQEQFKALRQYQQLSRWLVDTHDDIRKILKKGTSSSKNWTAFYAKKYRVAGSLRNARVVSNGNGNTGTNKNSIGISILRADLRVRRKPMHAFLSLKFGEDEFKSWTTDKKAKYRAQYLNEAAEYYWVQYMKDGAQRVKYWGSMSLVQKRARVIEQFRTDFFRARQYPYYMFIQAVVEPLKAIKNSMPTLD